MNSAKYYVSLFQKPIFISHKAHILNQLIINLTSSCLLVALLAYQPQLQGQQCGCLNCPATIPVDDVTFSVDYGVAGLMNDDLAGGQCVQSVSIEFQHNRLQNMIIELVSPSGQVVPLIGPHLPFGGGLSGTFGANWNIQFVQCFPNGFAAPDPFVGQVWFNGDPGWSIFGGSFIGTYYPTENNCLESFDNGSANGTWQLRVQNFSFPPVPAPGVIASFSITFCDETGLGCCAADGGTLPAASLLSDCEGASSLLIPTTPTFTGNPPDSLLYNYGYLIVRNDSVVAVQPSPDLQNFPAGDYLIQGVSFLRTDSIVLFQDFFTRSHSDLITNSFSSCAALSSNTFQVSISENPPLTILNDSFCENRFYVFETDTLRIGGTYQFNLPSFNGCDSVIQLNLTQIPSVVTTIQDGVCQNGVYLFGLDTLRSPGTFTQAFTSIVGCDSIVNLELTELQGVSVNLQAAICGNDFFVFGSDTLRVAGNYSRTLSSTSGCDSLVNLQLSVLPSLETNLSQQICSNDFFLFGSDTLRVAGNYSRTLSSSSGCDSLVNLQLSVLPSLETNLSQQICSNDFFLFGSDTLHVAGNYSRTLSSTSGCDSLVNLQLSVLPSLETNLSQQICGNDFFVFGSDTLRVAGNYSRTLSSASGCDSLVNLQLSVLPSLETNLSQQICSNDFFVFGSDTLRVAGNYNRTLSSTSGCDSLVNLQLSVLPSLETNLSQQICGSDFFLFGSDTLRVAGNYSRTLSSASGCDSLVNLQLSILPSLETNLSQQICSNDFFLFGSDTLRVAGNYNRTLSSASGCDSLVNLQLSVLPSLETNLSQQICGNDFFLFGNDTLHVAGNYSRALSSASGCDSLVNLQLSVTDLNATIEAPQGQQISCDTDSILLIGRTNDTNAQIFWRSNGMILSEQEILNVSLAGNYDWVVITKDGCTDSAQIEVTVDSVAITGASISIVQPVCGELNSTGSAVVQSVIGGNAPYLYAVDELPFLATNSFSALTLGNHLLTFQDANGCEWDTIITISAPTDLQIDLGEDQVLLLGDQALLELFVNKAYQSVLWSASTKDTFSCQDCLQQVVNPTTTTVYSVQVIDENGCTAQDQVVIYVEQNYAIFFPNAFSPNGDNVNDYFFIQSRRNIIAQIEQFQVFDRWGNIVFQKSEWQPNTENEGWDGASNGKIMNPAVFTWVAKIKLLDGQSVIFSGELNLLD